jgi:hypothetical protein
MTIRTLFAAAAVTLVSATASLAATTGYTYTATNAQFDFVQAPSFASVADPDGYTVTVGLNDFALLPGVQLIFPSPVSQFTLTGIDPALNLDPNNPLAFPLGVGFDNITGAITLSIDPIITSAVPLPAGGLLLTTAFGGLIAFQRRKKRAA